MAEGESRPAGPPQDGEGTTGSGQQQRSEATRREFLRLVGGALGGVALGMYGGGGAYGQGGGNGLPNGYVFYRVFTLGGANPFPFAPLTDLIPGVMLTEQDQILFHGANSTGLRGVYALNMSYGLSSGSTPQVLGGSKLVQVGDVLPDGRPVRNIAPGDTNALGSYATVIGTGNPNTEFDPTNSGLITPNPGLPAAFGGTDDWTPQSPDPASSAPPITASGVYIQKDPGSGLQPLVNLSSPTPPLDQKGTQGQFGAIHGDIALQDDDSILLSAFYSLYNTDLGPNGTPIGPQAQQGLFNLVGGTASDQGTLVQTTGDVLPLSGALLTGFGLVDVSPDGYYVAQAYAAHRGRGGGWGRGVQRGPGGPHPSVLLNGHVARRGSTRLLAASRELVPPRSNVAVGETILGPRVGRRNWIGHVVHTTESHHQVVLHRNGASTRAHQTGTRLLGDYATVTTSPVVVAPTGLFYFTTIDAGGYTHLWVSTGQPNDPTATTKLLLSSQDTTVNGGGMVTEMWFGYHTAQADSAGRIIFTAEFLSDPNADPTNPANITTSIVVGIPV